MLPNLPFGFGPLRFRTVFELDPHNSFIGAFANEGWIGEFVWIMMTGMSTFVGFRVMTRPSPYRRLAPTFFPALFPTSCSSDRHRSSAPALLMPRAVWGLEAARQRWVAAQPAAAEESPQPASALDDLAPATHPG
jgi:hypothetical protein